MSPDRCTCYPTTTILCAYCEATLCDRCTEPEDLCTCPTDGAPQTQAEVTAGWSPEPNLHNRRNPE